jgi:hypothetical protein
MLCKHDLPISAKCQACYLDGMANEAEFVTKGHKPKSHKAKTCKVCKQKFIPRRDMQSCCSYPAQCEAIRAEQVLAKKLARDQKAQRQETRAKRLELKPRQKWLKEAEAAVNRYCRLRDYNDGCISCDKLASWHGQWHASHWRSVGASSATRFNLWNIHKSCSICNNWKSGNLADYTPALEQKIGPVKLEWLKSQTQPVTYSIEYLERLKRIFNKRANLLERRLGLK